MKIEKTGKKGKKRGRGERAGDGSVREARGERSGTLAGQKKKRKKENNKTQGGETIHLLRKREKEKEAVPPEGSRDGRRIFWITEVREGEGE